MTLREGEEKFKRIGIEVMHETIHLHVWRCVSVKEFGNFFLFTDNLKAKSVTKRHWYFPPKNSLEEKMATGFCKSTMILNFQQLD